MSGKVGIRAFNELTDAGFIYGTFTKGVFYGYFKPETRPDTEKEFIDLFSIYLKDQLKNAQIYVAYALNDINFLVGYAIINNKVLEWVFVKPHYRRHGIAKLLLKNKEITSVNEKNLTETGFELLKKYEQKKELENASTTQTTH
jgi:GNAT superfamily N-acetyltransferase